MAVEEEIIRARTLIEALPYIKRFAGKFVVIQLGGSLVAEKHRERSFAADLVLLKYVGIHPIVVHGGGKELSQWLHRLGRSSGREKDTDLSEGETSVIREMVLSGKVNNEIVSAINRAGGKAVGLSGKDANLFIARRTKERSELGFIGEIESTDVSLLRNLTSQGYIPVISSLGLSREGESFEVNPDNVSGEIAESLKATKLIYLTESAGVMKGGELLPFLDLQDATAVLSDGAVAPEMRSMVEKSVCALKGGVTNVHILDGALEHAVLLEIFTDTGVGTMISNERIRV